MSERDESTSEPKRSQSPVVWALLGACAVVVLILAGMGAMQFLRGPEKALPNVTSIPASATAKEQPEEATVSVATKEKVSTPQEIIARVKNSVVLVEVELPDGVASGSGFPIDEHRVATCAHVVAEASSIKVITADGTQVEATVEDTDIANDIAVLRCEAGLPDPLPLGDSKQVQEGEDVAVTGFPVVTKLQSMGYVPVASTSRGSISAVRRRRAEVGEFTELQTDAAINPGNSGGPLYSLKTGKVLGLASSKLVEESGIAFAVPVSALSELAGPVAAPSQTAASAGRDAAVFAVDDKGNLDTVVMLKRGKYVWPTHPELEGETTASVTFDANYFRPGKKFTVVFGGAPAGTVEFTSARKHSAGITFRATVALQTTAPLMGRLQALATDAPQLAGAASTRRAPTSSERVIAEADATALFIRKGIPISSASKVNTLNITAGDVNGDGRHELFGSYQVKQGERKQNVFLLLEPDNAGGFRRGVAEFYLCEDQYGVDAQEQRLIDWIDLDQDGTAEVVTISHFYESWQYKIYSHRNGKWTNVYHGHGGGS